MVISNKWVETHNLRGDDPPLPSVVIKVFDMIRLDQSNLGELRRGEAVKDHPHNQQQDGDQTGDKEIACERQTANFAPAEDEEEQPKE